MFGNGTFYKQGVDKVTFEMMMKAVPSPQPMTSLILALFLLVVQTDIVNNKMDKYTEMYLILYIVSLRV